MCAKNLAGRHDEGMRRSSEEVSESAIKRRILRFYHQVGILLDKGLIDPDFVSVLIGGGLKTSKKGILAATQLYQNFYDGTSGIEERPPRHICANAVTLVVTLVERSTSVGKQNKPGAWPDLLARLRLRPSRLAVLQA